MTTVIDDPLLGFALPRDQPGPAAGTAHALVEAADRVGVLARRVGAMLPAHRWSGTASASADRSLAAVALGLAQERRVLLAAASTLTRFAGQVSVAAQAADEARRLVASARSVQRSADRRAPATAVTGWGSSRLDGDVRDPAAVTLLDRARVRAYEARSTYDAAARRLTAELTDLSGRRVERAGLSPRLLLDAVGFVPVVGDAVDLANAAAYALQGHWDDAALTAVAAVPGPEGWAAASAKIGKAASRAGDVVKVVGDVPAEQRVVDVLAGLTVRGRRKETRLLDDGDAVETLYRRSFEPLGPTVLTKNKLGEDLLVTHLPGGGRISLRWSSGTGGPAIEFVDISGVDIMRVHVRDR
jgi:hypothetical protein